MPQLKQRTVRVLLAPDDEHDVVREHTIQLTLGDQLRAELEGRKNGTPVTDLGLHATALTVWAALSRLGLYGAPFQQFAQVDCLDYDTPKTHDEDDVPPTPPAASNGSA